MTSSARARSCSENRTQELYRLRVLRGGRANGVDQIEATLDAVEPAVDVVEPFLNGCIIQLDAGDLALERAKPRHNFVELATDMVETIVEPRETSAQKVENIAGLAHA